MKQPMASLVCNRTSDIHGLLQMMRGGGWEETLKAKSKINEAAAGSRTTGITEVVIVNNPDL